MTPPISIGGTDITGATIDGTDVQEITVDGDVVFSGLEPWETADLVHNYDAANLSTGVLNTFPDAEGNNDATANNGNPTVTGTKNGLNYVRYDGNDSHRVDTGESYTTFTLIAVVKTINLSVNNKGDNFIIADNTDYYPSLANTTFQVNGYMYRGETESIAGGSPLNWSVVTVIKNGTSAELREDGSTIGTKSVANESFDPVSLGAFGTGANFADIELGQALIYDADISADIATIESALQSRWGI